MDGRTDGCMYIGLYIRLYAWMDGH